MTQQEPGSASRFPTLTNPPPRVGPADPRQTHDISLSDGLITLYLRLANGQGEPEPLSWREDPAPRTALQIRTGDPSYSNYELPYTPITQKDFGGGRGSADFERDATRYYHGAGVDTRRGDLILAPQVSAGQAVTTWPENSIFFLYRQALYVVCSHPSGAPQIWQNGWRASATAGSGGSTVNTALSFAADALAGKIMRLTSGAGTQDAVQWRVISTNTAGPNTTITVSPAWNYAIDTTTEFVLLGLDSWTEITGHGLTQPVTDVLVAGNTIYFAQGENTNIRRGRIASGGWEWLDDGTNKATFLELIASPTGKNLVWAAQATACLVFSGELIDWSATTSLTLTVQNSGKTIGNQKYKITGLAAYGTPQAPWVFKENEFGSMGGGTATTTDFYSRVAINELAAVSSELNGAAALQSDQYLYFSMLDGLERYMDNRLDDRGPNRDEGLPAFYRGPITKMIGYPGGILATVIQNPAILSTNSMILYYNQLGWSELWTNPSSTGAPAITRVTGLAVQVIPGETVDRLWFISGSTAYWMPIALNPLKQPGYLFRSAGDWISSWYWGGYREVKKYLDSLVLYTENLSGPRGITVTASYQTDGEGDSDQWHLIGTFTQSPIQRLLFTPDATAYGQRWRLKLRLATGDPAVTPRVIALTMNTVTRIEPKRSWNLTFLADDVLRDQQGQATMISAEELRSQIQTWATSDTQPTPITAHSNYLALFDGLKVFIDPPVIRPVEVTASPNPAGKKRIKLIGTVSIYEK